MAPDEDDAPHESPRPDADAASAAGGPAASRVASTLVASSPVYYGWVVLAAATLGMAATLPGQTAGVSLFIDAFIEDLDLSRSVVSWLYTVATVLGSLSLPLVGRLVDRFGPRRMAVAVVALFAAACAGMSWVSGWIGVFVGFVCLRGLGQGSLGLINNHAVNLWFEHRRGTAIGVLGLGLSGATAVFPPLIERGLQAYGWETTYLIMGGVLAAVMLPLAAVFFRDAPERYGVAPPEPAGEEAGGVLASGAPPAEADEEDERPEGTLRGVTLAEARRTRTFWLFTIAGVCTAGFGTGLLFHHFSILEEVGVARDLAARFFIPLGVVTAASNLGTGWLVDRSPPRLLLAGLLALFGAMLALLPFVRTAAGVWAYGSVFGVAQGMQGALLGTAYAYYFGRAHHGTIRGLATTVFVGGTAIGPSILALGPDLMSGFAPILWIVTPVPLVLSAAALVGWAADWDAEVHLA
jgi:MFS family permease